MKVYHSSNLVIPNPDILHSRDYLDFGKGFYLTSIESQAIMYAQRFLRRGEEGWLNCYDLDFNEIEWKLRQFDSYDEEWLEFISKCRAGEDDTDFDIVIGGVANDKVIRTLDRYFAGELSVGDTLGLLRYEKPNNQYCIRSQKMLDECLTHMESKKL